MLDNSLPWYSNYKAIEYLSISFCSPDPFSSNSGSSPLGACWPLLHEALALQRTFEALRSIPGHQSQCSGRQPPAQMGVLFACPSQLLFHFTAALQPPKLLHPCFCISLMMIKSIPFCMHQSAGQGDGRTDLQLQVLVCSQPFLHKNAQLFPPIIKGKMRLHENISTPPIQSRTAICGLQNGSQRHSVKNGEATEEVEQADMCMSTQNRIFLSTEIRSHPQR